MDYRWVAFNLCCQAFKISRNGRRWTLPRAVEVYEKRKAQIVVDPEPQFARAISAIANEKSQSLYVKQPYNDILQHLRSQWVFNNSPSKPTIEVIEGSPSRKDWDVNLYPFSILFIC